MSEKRWTIGRPINGVSLNGLEYLCDNTGRQLMYDSEESARADLIRYGYSDKRIEDEGIVICCFNEGDYMAALEKRNSELEAKVAELEDKHWNECRQIAHYDDELKATEEAARRTADYGKATPVQFRDLLDNWAKMKKLLKAAVEGFEFLGAWMDEHGDCTLDCSDCPLHKPGYYCRGWNKQDEALALIGEDGVKNE